MFLTAQALAPFWGATLIDGYEGMEGNGPVLGHAGALPRGHRLDRFHRGGPRRRRSDGDQSRLDGLPPVSARDFGVGQYDLAKIDVRGEKIADVARKYQLHNDIERAVAVDGADEGPAAEDRVAFFAAVQTR